MTQDRSLATDERVHGRVFKRSRETRSINPHTATRIWPAYPSRVKLHRDDFTLTGVIEPYGPRSAAGTTPIPSFRR